MLRPVLDFKDIYPPNTAFTWYAPEETTRWLPPGPWLSNYPLPLARDLPVVVHESVVQASVTPLLRSLSSSFCSQIETVASEVECRIRLQELVAKGFKIHADYRLPRDWLPASAYAVDPDLLEKLNNKAALEKWVPAGFYPGRFPVDLNDLKAQNPLPFPYVVKAISSFGSGNGIDIRVCRNDGDRKKALAYFEGENEAIVEEWIPDARLFCVQGVISGEGSYRYLGCSEQICDDAGSPMGNWIDEESEIGPEGISLMERIIRKGGTAGFRGPAGIDILKTEDGTLKVIDLNFRNCNSTRGLLFREELRQMWDWDCMTIRSIVCHGNADLFLGTLTAAAEEKRVFPWGIQISGNQIKATLLCGGRSRREAAARFNVLAHQLAG